MRELWKTIPFEPRYQVSNKGRIRRANNKRIRKTPIKQNGYYGLVLTYPGDGKLILKGYDLHYLIAITWLGPRPPGYDISHQDGNRLNNAVSNLKYESRKENSQKYFNNFHREGGKRKVTPKLVEAIRKDTRLSNNQWAQKLKVKRTTIWKIRNRKTWKHI